MNWLNRFWLWRQRRRYRKWVNEMRAKNVIFEKPLSDPRDWSKAHMRSIKNERR